MEGRERLKGVHTIASRAFDLTYTAAVRTIARTSFGGDCQSRQIELSHAARHQRAVILRAHETGRVAVQLSYPERTNLPGNFPVASPSRYVVTPLLTIARYPRARCRNRRPPAGRSRRISGRDAASASRSNTARSAFMPGATTPRSKSPTASAGRRVRNLTSHGNGRRPIARSRPQ